MEFSVRRLVVGNLKGGPGKTTTAMHLAVVIFMLTGRKVLVVDADAVSQTASDWGTVLRARTGGRMAGVTVVQWTDFYRGMLDEYQYVIFDTGGEAAAAFSHALGMCDTVVIPTGPYPAELRRLLPTVEQVKLAAKGHPITATILLTRVPTNTTEGRDARQALVEDQGLPVMEAEIPLRRMYRDNFGTAIGDPGDYVLVWFELNGLDLPEPDELDEMLRTWEGAAA